MASETKGPSRLKFVVLLALFLVACGSVAPPLEPSSSVVPELHSPSPMPATACIQPNDPNSHVYHPQRLHVIQPCITVTGIIDFVRKEADGDYHIGLKLDPPYAGLVNDCNRTCAGGSVYGDLIVEPVCQLPVTQADAQAACAGYTGPKFTIPAVGDHVSIQGAYVLDTAHGWLEIHPVTAMGVVK
jgi:hypothetical protein